MLLDDVFQQLQAYMGVHSELNCQKGSSHITGKNKAFWVKNKEKNQNKSNNKAKSGYSRVQFPLVLCVAIIYISPESQTDVVQSFVVDFVEHVVTVPNGAHLACYQAERWNRGYTRFATKEEKKKKSVSDTKSAHHKHQVKKPQQNAKNKFKHATGSSYELQPP